MPTKKDGREILIVAKMSNGLSLPRGLDSLLMCRVAENTRSPPRMTAEVTNARAWMCSFCLLGFMRTSWNLAVIAIIDDAIVVQPRWGKQ